MVHFTNASDDDDDFVLEDSKSTLVTEAGADDEPHGQELECVARQPKRRRQRARKKKQREESQQRQPSPQQVPLNDLSKPTAPPCGRQVGAMRRNVTPPMSHARHRSFREMVPQKWWHGNLAGTVRSGCYRGPHHPRRRTILCLDVVLGNLVETGVHAMTHRWKPVLKSRICSTAVRKA